MKKQESLNIELKLKSCYKIYKLRNKKDEIRKSWFYLTFPVLIWFSNTTGAFYHKINCRNYFCQMLRFSINFCLSYYTKTLFFVKFKACTSVKSFWMSKIANYFFFLFELFDGRHKKSLCIFNINPIYYVEEKHPRIPRVRIFLCFFFPSIHIIYVVLYIIDLHQLSMFCIFFMYLNLLLHRKYSYFDLLQ